MKKITLHHPNICRLLLILPILIYLCFSVVICFLLSGTHKVCLAAGIAFFVLLLFILSRYKLFHYLFTISSIQKLLKEDNAISTSKELRKKRRPLYLLWHDQSLLEFIHGQNEFLKGYSAEAASLSKTMKNRDFVLCEECVYYRYQDHIVSICFDADENDPTHLFIYPDFSHWDYPKCSEISKNTQALIQEGNRKIFQGEWVYI